MSPSAFPEMSFGLSQASDLANIVVAVGTLVAILVTLRVSYQTFKETRIDRKLRIRPILAFVPTSVPLATVRRRFERRIGGINPSWVEENFDSTFDSRLVTDLDDMQGTHYGVIRNIGSGPALDIKVTWIPERMTLNRDGGHIEKSEFSELAYSEGLNATPVVSNILRSGEDGELSRLPSFFILDFRNEIEEVEGWLEIRYRSIESDVQLIRQRFYIWNRGTGPSSPDVTITFGEIE